MYSARQSYVYPTTFAHPDIIAANHSTLHIFVAFDCVLSPYRINSCPSYSYPAFSVALTLSRLSISSREMRGTAPYHRIPALMKGGPVRRVACMPDEDVRGGEAGSGQLSSVHYQQQPCICVQHGCMPPSVISGGARAGHDRSNDTVALDEQVG